MNISMMVYDNNGCTRGNLRMKLDFGSEAPQWSIVEDAAQLWRKLGYSQLGPMNVNGTNVSILDQPPGKLKQPVLALMNVPQTGACAGTGKTTGAIDTAFSDGAVYWVVEPSKLSPIRQAMVEVLQEYIPQPVISSDDPLFYRLLRYNTQALLDNFWEPENKVPAWPKDKMPAKNTTFTTCNMTLGCIAGKLGEKLGKKVGLWLGRGPLLLDLVDKDKPGCWIPGNSGKSPQVGDFYSVADGAQKFGHVGTIGKIDDGGMWTAFDGGQGGYRSANKKDFIKQVPRGKLIPSSMNGWIDIDIYFS